MLSEALVLVTPVNVAGIVVAGLVSGWIAWPFLHWRPGVVVQHGVLAGSSYYVYVLLLRWLDPAIPDVSAWRTIGAAILWLVWVLSIAAGMAARIRRETR